jgi:hypothetical protein
VPVVLVVLIVVAAAGALLGLAWWWSGRSLRSGHNPVAEAERGEAESQARDHYRPSGGHTPGPLI